MQAIIDLASKGGFRCETISGEGSLFMDGRETARFGFGGVVLFGDGATLRFRADSAELAWWLGLVPVAAPVAEVTAPTKTHYQIVKCGDGEGSSDEVIATVEGSFGVALAMGRELARGKGITLRFVKVTEEDVTPVATEGELQTVLPVPTAKPLATITTSRGHRATPRQISRAEFVRGVRLELLDAQIGEYAAEGEAEAVEILRVLRAALCAESDAAVILDAWDSLWCYDLETIVSTPRSRSDYVRAVHAKCGAEPLIQALIAEMRQH